MIFSKKESKSKLTDNLLNELKLLTPKEFEVYDGLMEGYKLKEIAEMLNVKFTTINEHTKSIYKKLNIHSQKELIIKYHPIFRSKEVED